MAKAAQPRGHRDRKKAETRRALSAAALRLAVERGLDNVLIEEIAAAANVSPRTFNNYFSSKHEAIVGLAVDEARRVGAVLLARPKSEPLWDSITHAVLQQYVEAEKRHDEVEQRVRYEAWLAGLRLMMKAPELRGEVLKFYEATQHSLAAAIAERRGTNLERDIVPSLLAGAVASATEVATNRWLRADVKARGSLASRIKSALRQLAQAFTDGSLMPCARRAVSKGSKR